jgi:hypothetical protein
MPNQGAYDELAKNVDPIKKHKMQRDRELLRERVDDIDKDSK